MDYRNPSAGAGAARPEISILSGGFTPAAFPWTSSCAGAAPLSPGGLGPSPSPGFIMEALLASPTATPMALGESTLRLVSGLESMSLTGGEPLAVERPPMPISTTTTTVRKRTPGRWRRITRYWTPPEHQPHVKAKMDKWDLITLENIERIKNMREEDCDLVTEQDRLDFYDYKEKMVRCLSSIANSKPENTKVAYKRFSDTKKEHLTAEAMEAHILEQFPNRKPCQQAKHFAKLALDHYNKNKTEPHKFELAMTLFSKCFSESSGTTYGHVNFTAILADKTASQPTSKTKKLFFAELMLIPELQADPKVEPMRVVHVYTIDDDYCYGGCHKIFRRIKHKMRGDMDYERCHACSDLIKHPKGQLFEGGHNSSRMPYYSAV